MDEMEVKMCTNCREVNRGGQIDLVHGYKCWRRARKAWPTLSRAVVDEVLFKGGAFVLEMSKLGLPI